MPPRSWNCILCGLVRLDRRMSPENVCRSCKARRVWAASNVNASVGASLLPFGDICSGDRLDWQNLVFRQLLAIEMVGNHLSCSQSCPGRDLRAGAVLLTGFDCGNALLETVAADDDQLAFSMPSGMLADLAACTMAAAWLSAMP